MLCARVVFHAVLLLLSLVPVSAQEHQTPWHVPIPTEGPRVGIVWWVELPPVDPKDAKAGFLRAMWLFRDVGLFAQAGYRPTILLPANMVGHTLVQRALKLCDYPSLAAPLSAGTDLQQFSLLFVPMSRGFSAPGLVPILERYVEGGGKVIYTGLYGRNDEKHLGFVAAEAAEPFVVPFSLNQAVDHPILAGVQLPLEGSWPGTGNRIAAYRATGKRGTTILRYQGAAAAALTLRQDGPGQVAFLNIDHIAASKMGLNADGFMLGDLILRTADWMTGSHAVGPRPPSKERIARLKETDALRPGGSEAVLFRAAFSHPGDIGAWDTWDAPKAAAESGVPQSEWWIDANMGALVQSSTIWSTRGVGSMATAGEAGWVDYVVSATITPFDEGQFGISFRVQDPDNYYRFVLDANPIVRVRLERIEKGRIAQLAGVARPYLPCVPMRFQIQVKGDTFVVYCAGKELMRATDDRFRMGKVGIETSGDSLAVYDFQVFSVP